MAEPFARNAPHEEVNKAFEEGVRFAECLSPQEVELDGFGHAAALRFAQYALDPESNKLRATGEYVTLPARSILVAAGTQPNTVLAREDQHVVLDGKHFRALDEQGNPVKPEPLAKPEQPRVLASLRADGKGASFFGDLHPSYSGNVVKAMASAKQGYPILSRVLARVPPSPAPRLMDLLG
jgi:NADPH-dependent glutamate synthase beta subunit-like oxidoreductase